MPDAIVTAALGVLTVLGSGITSSVLTHRLSRRQSQTLFLREKAEKLYLAADEFGKSFAGHWLSYGPLFDGRYDYNAMLDQQIAAASRPIKYGGAETMTMLVEIYFPSARPALQSVWSARAEYNDITALIKAQWTHRGSVDARLYRPKLEAAGLKVDEAISAVKLRVVEAARLSSGVKQ